MVTGPVLALLVYDLVIFLAAISNYKDAIKRRQLLLLCGLFFCSGMPALIYQIVWQRALFAIYGVNAESVAVVVSAFMLGLGLGSLVGGWISARLPGRTMALFGAAELGVALFGICSLRIFHWVSLRTAGASLPATVVLSLVLLIVPTMLMGATLPLLVEHLVRVSRNVGSSVGTLYFVNTFGSAVVCYLCGTFLLRDLGQAGAVRLAATVNAAVGASALLFGLMQQSHGREFAAAEPVRSMQVNGSPTAGAELSLRAALWIAGLCGFIALGFEILWFRVFVLASTDRAPMFAFLLSTCLAGIAGGSFIAGRLTEKKSATEIAKSVGISMLIAGGASAYLPPAVAWLKTLNIEFLLAAPLFFVVSATLGSVLPLLCELGVEADDLAGRGVSLVYVANIIGSTLGSLVVGFVMLQYLGLRAVSLSLASLAAIGGSLVLGKATRKARKPFRSVAVATLVAGLAIAGAAWSYEGIFEKLIYGPARAETGPFAHVVENRNGVIAVTQKGAVLGNGVYDGFFNTDPANNENLIQRAYALSFFHPAPKRLLVIGLSSGSWAQILIHHPQAESMDIVEINPGYLQLIARYPVVESLLRNPRVHIYVDDGRRWLLAHQQARYDAIVQNTSFYWRDHSSDLLSVDYLKIVREHLLPGGVYFYNTTGSDEVVATGLHVFPYGLRVMNFLAVSDAPLQYNRERMMAMLRAYRIDGKLLFDPADPASERTLARYESFVDTLTKPPNERGMETSDSLNARLRPRLIITDDNMGWEWRSLDQDGSH
jgi:spermidine synthase